MFGVSRQVYSRAKKRNTVNQVVEKVSQVRLNMSELSAPKLYSILHRELRDLVVSRDRLFSILKSNQMLVVPKRNYQVTRNSHYRFRKHENLVENMRFNRPEQVWVTNITYIGNRENQMCLL